MKQKQFEEMRTVQFQSLFSQQYVKVSTFVLNILTQNKYIKILNILKQNIFRSIFCQLNFSDNIIMLIYQSISITVIIKNVKRHVLYIKIRVD